MQQFTPWFFTNNQQQTGWSPQAMNANPFTQAFTSENNPYTAPSFAAGQSGFDLHQMMAFWQQQIQQFSANPLFSQSNPSQHSAYFSAEKLESLFPFNPAGQKVAQSAMALMHLMSSDHNEDALRRATANYAMAVLQATRQNAGEVSDYQLMGALCAQLRIGVQWSIDQSTSISSSGIAEIDQYQETLVIWLQCIDAMIAMCTLHTTFSTTVQASFVEQCVDASAKGTLAFNDEKQLLSFFTKHYEDHFTRWLQTPEYRQVYGCLINATTAMKTNQQGYINRTVEGFGLPSKQEMDTTHKRAHDQDKKIRVLQKQVEQLLQQDTHSLVAQIGQLTTQVANLQQALEALTATKPTAKKTIKKSAAKPTTPTAPKNTDN